MAETPKQKADRLAERKRVDDFMAKGLARRRKAPPAAPQRKPGPATAAELAARRKVVAADVKATAAKNASGRAAQLREKYTPSGLQSLVDVMGKKKKKP